MVIIEVDDYNMSEKVGKSKQVKTLEAPKAYYNMSEKVGKSKHNQRCHVIGMGQL